MAGLVCLAPAWAPAAAPPTGIGPPLLDPADHASPSGAYVLHVEPTERHGKGPADCTLSREGAVVWQTRLPFSFWDAVVSDDGLVAGYAYTQGLSGGRDMGDFVVAILERDGAIGFRETTPRTSSRTVHGHPDPQAAGLYLHPDLGRVVVRLRDAYASRLGESWRTYDLARLERHGEVSPQDLLPEDAHASFSIDARAVPSTPLTLVHWYCYRRQGTGARFSLLDADGAEVWQLALPDDYDLPDEDEQGALLDEIRRDGALLDVGPARFDLRLVRDGVRASFSVGADASSHGLWIVEETGRRPYVAVPVGPIVGDATVEVRLADRPSTLRLLASVDLAVPAPTSEVRDVVAFDVEADGTLHLIRGEPGERVYTALAVDAAGRVLRSRAFEPLAPGEDGRVSWTPRGHGEWLVTFSPFGEGAQSRAWHTDASTPGLVPLPAFAAPHVEQAVVYGDGGYVLLATIHKPYTIEHVLMRCASDGRPLWTKHASQDRPDGLGSPEDLAVLPDGSIVVLDNVRDVLQVFDPAGEFVRAIELAASWGREPGYPAMVALDADDGLLVEDFGGEPPIVRMATDGGLRGTLVPRFADGRAPRELAMHLRAAPDGRLWTTDEQALLRLDETGLVDLVVGALPDDTTLAEPGSGLVSPLGRVLVQDRRDASVHVFDTSGARLAVCKADAADFPRGPGFLPALALSDDGGPCVEIPDAEDVTFGFLGGKDYATFDAAGVRLGTRTLGADAVFVPGAGSWWRTAAISTRVELCAPDGTVTATIEHAPDGTWLRRVQDLAVAPDGSLAILQDPGAREDRRCSIALYGPDGAPRVQLVLPEGLRPYRLAYGDGWLALGASESATMRLVRLSDATLHVTKTDVPFDRGDFWEPAFSADGSEVWWLNASQLELHRFALLDEG